MFNILICEDERDIRNAVKIYLENDEYKFFEAVNGEDGVEITAKHDIHLILMDVMMPKMDGISATEVIRKDKNMPILFLTAKSEDIDIVSGLNAGGDDYITKPFNPIELRARVKSALRRFSTLGGMKFEKNTLSVSGITLNNESKKVHVDGLEVFLTPLEFDILKLLMNNVGRLFSPKEIYEHVWMDTSLGNEQTVAVHIRHLREKIEIDPANPRHIKVIWGRGYKIEE